MFIDLAARNSGCYTKFIKNRNGKIEPSLSVFLLRFDLLTLLLLNLENLEMNLKNRGGNGEVWEKSVSVAY